MLFTELREIFLYEHAKGRPVPSPDRVIRLYKEKKNREAAATRELRFWLKQKIKQETPYSSSLGEVYRKTINIRSFTIICLENIIKIGLSQGTVN